MRLLTRSFLLCLISALLALPAFALDASISVQKTCTPDAFVNDTFTSTVTVTNSGSRTLTNVVVTDSDAGSLSLPAEWLDTLAAGASYTWTIPMSISDAGPHYSNVDASGNDDSDVVEDSVSCATNVWSLFVTKTAGTSFTRDWRWTLTKSTNATGTITIGHGASATIGYTVTTTPHAADSAWRVSGVVTVHNSAPISATVTSLSDTLSDNTPVSLNCGGPAPYTIAGGGDLTCTYSIGRSGAINGTNSASATLANNNGGSTTFSGSADYTFGDPTTVLHANANVVDSGANVANADNTGSAGWSVVNPPPVGAFYMAPNGGSFGYSTTVTNVSMACDNFAGVINGASLFDGEHVILASATQTVYTGACTSTGGGSNCTLSIGYWKTHAGFTGRNPDRVTPELPQSLGTAGGPKTVKVTTATQAVNVLSFNGEASNGVNKLYAQLLAAKLNIFRGASPAAVSSVISAADAFLATNNSAGWAAMSKNTQKQVNGWMSTFDQYNNGLIGPGHCE